MGSLCPIIQHHRNCSSMILPRKKMARYNVSKIDNYDVIFTDAFHMNSFYTWHQFLSYDYKQ